MFGVLGEFGACYTRCVCVDGVIETGDVCLPLRIGQLTVSEKESVRTLICEKEYIIYL